MFTNFIMPPRHYRKYTQEQLKEAVSSSTSVRQTLNLLDLAPYGGNYKTIHKAIQDLGLDISHWTGQSWRKGTTEPVVPRQPDDKVFVKGRLFNSSLRARLIKRKLIPYSCALCPIATMWQGKPLSLHVDHIDGDRENNLLSNLRFLCPNCHTQTETYCRKKSCLPIPPHRLVG